MESLHDIQAAELKAVVDDAMGYFKAAVEKKGVVFTGELRDSFESYMSSNSTVIAAEIHFSFYGRYKDMKVLRWGDIPPPIEPLEEWVAKIGVEKFAWIPGYERSGKVPAESVAIRRIARTIQQSFRHATATRKYDGTWYNETKMKMINVARRRIMEVTAAYAVRFVVGELDN